MSKTTDIRDLDVLQITEALKAMGEPSFRAKQIHQWLWQKGARSFEEMTNLSKPLREKLAEAFTFHVAKIHTAQHSKDGTIKVAFELHDGNKIEGVMIPTSSRTTACVSSQVGCSLDCKFCATGYLKRMRNLTAAEIFDQVWIINELAEEHHGKRLDNIVYMGMGEPLLNYVNVLRSVQLIQKLADDGIKTNLALSLHSANNEKRSAIMPINDSNNLEMLAEALNYWYDKTGIRPTLEYTVIEGVNDGPEEEKELVIFAKKFPSKINLIEYNPISLADYQPTDRLDAFAAALEKQKLIVHVRRSRGKDIDAACGQLANQLA